MLQHYLKIAFRNLLKHRSFSLINITGMAIAMSASMLILFYVQYEFSFDKFWEYSGNTYRITCNRYQNGELTTKSAKALKNMAIVFKEELPGVKGAAEIFRDIVAVYTPENQIQDIDTEFSIQNSTFLVDFCSCRSAWPFCCYRNYLYPGMESINPKPRKCTTE